MSNSINDRRSCAVANLAINAATPVPAPGKTSKCPKHVSILEDRVRSWCDPLRCALVRPMPYAIVMLIEETAAPRIATPRHALAERESNGQVKFSDEQVRFNYPPHITLATFDDTADPHALVETLKATAAGWKPVPVAFDSIAILPRKPVRPMLARPNVTVEL